MKYTYISNPSCYTLFVILLILQTRVFANDEYYYRQAIGNDWLVKFKKIPSDIDYITSFPKKSMLEDPRVISATRKTRAQNEPFFDIVFKNQSDTTNTINLEYHVFTSLEDAEIYWTELRGLSTLGMTHVSDMKEPLDIGDNCWVAGDNSNITFIRNNVLVQVYVSLGDPPDSIKEFASLIDSLLINSMKVDNPTQMAAPVIEYVRKVNPDNNYIYEIVAHDPNNGKLLLSLIDI